MVGGALLMTNAQYRRVNGFANGYWGWGHEDDDMFERIKHTFRGGPARLSARDGRYRALPHPRVRDLDVTPVFVDGTRKLRRARGAAEGARALRGDGLAQLRRRARADGPLARADARDAEGGPSYRVLAVTDADRDPGARNVARGGNQAGQARIHNNCFFLCRRPKYRDASVCWGSLG